MMVLLKPGDCSPLRVEVSFSGPKSFQRAERLPHERPRDLLKLAPGYLPGQTTAQRCFCLNLIEDGSCNGYACCAISVRIGWELINHAPLRYLTNSHAQDTTLQKGRVVALTCSLEKRNTGSQPAILKDRDAARHALTRSATARANGGGKAFPTCRYDWVLPPANCHSSGNP